MRMRTKIKPLVALIALGLVLSLSAPALALSDSQLQQAAEGSARYMLQAVPHPQPGSIGGEWAVLGLARSGVQVPAGYFEGYYAALESYVRESRGVLHERKYTEYSRVIVALTAIGKDPGNVAGYDLLAPLGDYERTVWQGINGPIWALIALDCGGYDIPRNASAKTQSSRQLYIDAILERQLADGGFALSGTAADPDVTAMALQALARYQDQSRVKAATERALACLSSMQGSDGGFSSWSTANAESVAQVIVALCELGIDLDDPRFVKNGKTPLDSLLTYRQSDGSFIHSAAGNGENQMTSEQGLYSLVAAARAAAGKNSLYRMGDVSGGGTPQGLPGKDPRVKPMPVTALGLTFSDLTAADSKAAVEALAARGVISGMGDGTFRPQKTMTRAEFCTIITRGLGLQPQITSVFSDVPADKWYAGYIGTAHSLGIVNGVGQGRFAPEATITRQEAAAMVSRAARLCGMDTAMDAASVSRRLAQMSDQAAIDGWARESMAFCYERGLLDQAELKAEPKRAILRHEIAQILFNLLQAAQLI